MKFRNGAAALAGVVTIALLASCSQKKTSPPAPTAFERTTVEDCYTVDLFDEPKVEKPGSNIPAEWAAFSGRWGSAAWDGKWCHDLHVLKIAADGEVDVMDLHAPYDPWGKPATAFRRKGKISSDGRLRVTRSGVLREYWVQNGKLYGVRKEGTAELRIAMLPRVNRKF